MNHIDEKLRVHAAEQLRERAEEQQRLAEEIALRVHALLVEHSLMRTVRPE